MIEVDGTLVGAVHERATEESAAPAVTDVGASGATNGVDVIGCVNTPVPAALVAATRNA
jgi:hypothetical protein